MQDVNTKFKQIKQAYLDFEHSLQQSGKGLVYRTDKGIYGTTNLDNVLKFFQEINLQNYRHLLDLGCGDGRVVLIASLFTKATGIEYDKELVDVGKSIGVRLGIDCNLIVGDYLRHDLTNYDIIFMNPDHEFGELDQKLKDELRGPLFVHNEIFAPNSLKKGKKFWAGQIPIVKYTKE